MKFNYIKYILQHDLINEILTNHKDCENIIFYIDLLSICRGLYNKNVVLLEIDKYFSTRKMPDLLLTELSYFLNRLYSSYRNYNPKFVIFYDNGKCLQNSITYKWYKKGRSDNDYILEDKERDLFYQIKNYYLQKIEEDFHKPDLCSVINLNDYEADLVPYFIIDNYRQNEDCLNIILSLDKDLLQTCRFKNTIQCVSLYDKNKLKQTIYFRENAISYFYKKFKMGILTADYVPLLLALSGDKADNIPGIKGIGYSKAYDLIINNKLDASFWENSKFPKIIDDNKQLIIKNIALIDFAKQVERLPISTISYIKRRIEDWIIPMEPKESEDGLS